MLLRPPQQVGEHGGKEGPTRGDQSKVPLEQRREMEGMVIKEQLETLDAALVQLPIEETDAATAWRRNTVAGLT